MTLRSFDDGNSDEARQFLLDRRCERNHPKRHRTQKRSKAASEKKRNRVKFKADRKAKAHAIYRKKVRLFWAGLGDHP